MTYVLPVFLIITPIIYKYHLLIRYVSLKMFSY